MEPEEHEEREEQLRRRGLLGDGRQPFKLENRVRNPGALPNTTFL